MFTEDINDFLDVTDGFAVNVTVNGVARRAIFEVAWVEITIGHTPYSGERPTLYGKHSDFSGHFGHTVQKVNEITGATDSFKILDIRPDGSGACRVVLQET